jgi:hypothetical protein
MERRNKLTTIIFQDKGLLALFSGIILCGFGLLSVAVTACVWYL